LNLLQPPPDVLKGEPMAVIRSDQNVITQINVFEVDPKNQDAVVDLLKEAIRSVSGMPGWISASVHKSLDGKRVTNHAQAADYASWEKIVENLRNVGFFELTDAEPGGSHPSPTVIATKWPR
jgi:Antibiotic biosynthesis monooxygenase